MTKPNTPVDYADRLREAAALLATQGANPFRIAAYRDAADSLVAHAGELDALIDSEGAAGLERLPGIGRGIAGAVMEMARTGHWSQLERLRGESDPLQLFCSVPGLGRRLAARIHEELQIDTLEALETAAHDGRLDGVTGVGPRRAATIRANLQAMLGRRTPRPDRATRARPSIATLLAVDRSYREQAAQDTLPKIAPRRFNPEGEVWLPVLHAERDDWHFTALFSNTAQAHQFGRTHDWVVMYYYDEHHEEGQCTVVTETHGPLSGRRVVRGREPECRTHYLGTVNPSATESGARIRRAAHASMARRATRR